MAKRSVWAAVLQFEEDHPEEARAIEERVDREVREQKAWTQRLQRWRSPYGPDPVFNDQWLDAAEQRMKELGVTVETLKAAEYVLEHAIIQRKHDRLSNQQLDRLEANIAAEENERAKAI